MRSFSFQNGSGYAESGKGPAADRIVKWWIVPSLHEMGDATTNLLLRVGARGSSVSSYWSVIVSTSDHKPLSTICQAACMTCVRPLNACRCGAIS